MAGTLRDNSILEDYANLSINDENVEGLILDEPLEEQTGVDYTHCLVGRLLTNRKVNFMAMQDTLSSVWRPVKGVFMEATSYPNTFLFKFFHELDVRRVLEDGPWTFNQQTLIVKKLEADEQLANVKLFEISMWVQVYELPFGFKSEFILKSIGNYVGTFVKSDSKNFEGMWRNYLRILVSVDVRSPLKSQMRVKKTGGDWLWIKFKYEKLPSFCFYCGRIGHTDKFCEALFDNPEDKEVRKYDSSLRAQVQRQVGASTNQWLRSPDGRMLNPMEGRGNPVGSQVDGLMGQDSGGTSANGAVDGHVHVKSGAQVVTDFQNMARGKGLIDKGQEYGVDGRVNLVHDKTETVGNNLNVGGKTDLGLIDTNGLTFREQKRSRVDVSIQTGPKENNVGTDLEMTDTTNITEEVSKNRLKAGAALQTRQSL